jgi:hypothetical protein
MLFVYGLLAIVVYFGLFCLLIKLMDRVHEKSPTKFKLYYVIICLAHVGGAAYFILANSWVLGIGSK